MKAQTGHLKNTKFTLDLTGSDGVSMEGYPKIYDCQEEFTHEGTTFPELTDEEIALLTPEGYEPRLLAFIAKIKDENPTFDYDSYSFEDGENPLEFDTTLCPIEVVSA
jgi:hypothetical protein